MMRDERTDPSAPTTGVAAGKATPVRDAREPFVPLMLASLAAPLTWVLHFALLYLLEGLLCTPALPFGAAIPGTIALATVLGAAACAWLLYASAAWLRRAGAAELQSCVFLANVQRLFAGLALVAILWSGSAALLLSPCSFVY
ncbi:MAG: hypothetical protein SV422_05845 [Pseudomonadota bacterium]|nr:hypothetical protein [Pseudomonadota bacterium]